MADKYIREIEQILEEAERSGRKRGASSDPEEAPKPSRLLSPVAWAGSVFRVSPNKVVLGGIVLIVVSFVVYNAFNYLFAENVKFLLPVWAGLILFVIVYGLLFVRPGAQDKRWRGKMLDDGIEPSRWGRIRRWLDR